MPSFALSMVSLKIIYSNELVNRRSTGGFEMRVAVDGVSGRYHADLGDIVIRYPKHIRSLLFVLEVAGRHASSKAAFACCQHITPDSRINR